MIPSPFASVLRAFVLLLAFAAPAVAQPLSGIERSYMDERVRPGDDFDAYANGGWRETAFIPDDEVTAGVADEVSARVEQRNRALFDEILASNPRPGSPEGKIAAYYSAHADTDAIEARGLSPIQSKLDVINAIGSRDQLSHFLGRSIRADVDPLNNTDFYTENLFGVFVAQAPADPTRNVAYLLQGGLGVDDAAWYSATDPDSVELLDGYREYIAAIFSLAGYTEPEARAARVFALEQKIAAVHAPIEDSQEVELGNNPWTPEDFGTKAPGIVWAQFFEAARLAGQPEIIVWHPAATTGISALVASEPVETWKDYLTFHAFNLSTDVLPRAFDEANFGFYGELFSGLAEQQDRWRRAIEATNGALGDAVGRLYVDRHFRPEAKAAASAMVEDIRRAFAARIDAIDWMEPETKARAREKLAAIRIGIGYPETPVDYTHLQITDDAFGNLERARIFRYFWYLAKLGQPVDREEWWIVPQVVDALNLPLQNALNFPAGILDTPFFDASFDAAANYGAIGAVIGHEISHAFDDLGALFDAEGRLADWWTPDDFESFETAGSALVAQYDAYEALPGQFLPGDQMLGENIADLAGLAAAYDAYRLSLGGAEAPVIDGFTGDQRFFIAYAQSWRAKLRDEIIAQDLVSGVHAPERYRVQTVRNLDAWYEAFDVEPTDELYLPPAERVRIW